MKKKSQTKKKPSSGPPNPEPPDLHLPSKAQRREAFSTMSKEKTKEGRRKEAGKLEVIFKVVYLSVAYGLFIVFFIGMISLERCS
jgi:hypothetical protein